MKASNYILTVSASLALTLLVGCGSKDEEATQPPTTPGADAVEAGQAAEAPAAPTTANVRANGMIQQANTMIAQSKFAEARALLDQIAQMRLTEEQKQLVSSLKEQIEGR